MLYTSQVLVNYFLDHLMLEESAQNQLISMVKLVKIFVAVKVVAVGTNVLFHYPH